MHLGGPPGQAIASRISATAMGLPDKAMDQGPDRATAMAVMGRDRGMATAQKPGACTALVLALAVGRMDIGAALEMAAVQMGLGGLAADSRGPCGTFFSNEL